MIREAEAVGYTGDITIGIFVADPDNPPAEALEAVRRIRALGLGVKYIKPGNILIFYGGTT
jgi:hypothetical protein